jgi:hypothetical protein
MITENNSKGVTSPEVSDIQACPSVEDKQTDRQESAGQRYSISWTQVVDG